MTRCLSVSLDRKVVSRQTDRHGIEILTQRIEAHDPALGLRAVGVLHPLAEQVKTAAGTHARRQGRSWEQFGDALGMSRQSAHAQHGK